MKALIEKDADIILVNVDDELRYIDDEICNAVCPIIFYGMNSEFSFRLTGNPAVPYFYKKNGAYFRIPFQLAEIIAMIYKIQEGKKIENTAAMMVSGKKSKDRLISVFLHDIKPEGCGDFHERSLKIVEKEFGISGTTKEVRAKLEELQSQYSNSKDIFVATQTIPGVFCDVDDTLIVNNAINQKILEKLQKYAEAKAITLWTGGDLQEAEKVLDNLGITEYPLLSKYDFEGYQVEIAIDDLPQSEFEEKYKIKAEVYIQP